MAGESAGPQANGAGRGEAGASLPDRPGRRTAAGPGALLCAAAIVAGWVWLEAAHRGAVFARTRVREAAAGQESGESTGPGRYTLRVFFPDPDDYLRAWRARRIVAGDSVRLRRMPELNHPRGIALHWTAVMDSVVAGAGLLAGRLTDHPDPIGVGAAWVPVVLGVLYLSCLMGWMRRGFGWGPALLAGLLVAASPAFHRAFQLGHCDHQALLELLYVVAVGAWVPRGWTPGESNGPTRTAAVVSGVAAGLGIWTAAFSMLIWGALFLGIHFACHRAEEPARERYCAARRLWCLVVALVVAAGHAFENGPELGAAMVDRVSSLHLAVVLIAALVPVGRSAAGRKSDASGAAPAARPEASVEAQRHVTRTIALLFFVAAGVVWIAVHYDRAVAPLRGAPLARWHALNAEMQPLVAHAGGQWSLRPLHDRLGFLPYVLLAALPLFLLSKRVPPVLRCSLGLLAPVMAALTIRHLRFMDHYNLAVVPVVVVGLGEAFDRIAARSRAGRGGGRFAVIAALLLLAASPYLRATWARARGGEAGPPLALQRTDFVAQAIAAHERDAGASRDPRRAILCSEAEGPMLLYYTGLPVVAGPYHRSIEGIVEVARFFAERDPQAARARLDRLGVRYVVVPHRAHEQLMHFERVAFGELRSYDPPGRRLDARGRLREELHYRPGVRSTMAYRLWAEPGTPGIAGLALLRGAVDDPRRPEVENGLLYVVRDVPSGGRFGD